VTPCYSEVAQWQSTRSGPMQNVDDDRRDSVGTSERRGSDSPRGADGRIRVRAHPPRITWARPSTLRAVPMQHPESFDARLTMWRAWSWPESLRDMVHGEPSSAVRASAVYAQSPYLPVPFRAGVGHA
jgi:hypothetical protein